MLRNQVLAAAEQALTAEPAGLTVEALARLVSQRVGRQMPHRQVAEALRGKPERFLEGGDGRWRLRERPGVLTAEDEPDVSTGPAPSRPALRRGCYVVFDLEATGPSPESPETELLQIAARRYVDGAPGELWQTYVRPAAGTVPAQITALTTITSEQVRDAPDAAEALRRFFAHVGDLPLVAHNGAGFDGPLIEATCRRLGVPLPPTFRVLDSLPLARALLPTLPAHRVEDTGRALRLPPGRARTRPTSMCRCSATSSRACRASSTPARPAGPCTSCFAAPETHGPSCSRPRRGASPPAM